jgi:drug/metabolite transporter (DMT)-like permease
LAISNETPPGAVYPPGELYPPIKASAALTKGYVICFIGTVLWSSTAVFIRYLTETYRLPPLVLAFWRDMILASTLGLVFAIAKPTRLRVERRDLSFLLIYGLVLSLFNSTWTISVALNGAAVSTVLAYSSAAFTAVLGWRLFGERLGALKILAVTFSLLGCVFVAGAYNRLAWQVNMLGVVTGLFSGLAFAAYSLMGKAASQRAIEPWTTLLYTFAFAAVFILLYDLGAAWLPAGLASTDLFYLSKAASTAVSAATYPAAGGAVIGWLVLAILAVGPTAGGYGLYTVSLTYLPASVANIIATLEPAMTAILAYLFLGEMFTSPQWFGSILIALGVIILRIGESRGY